MQMVQWTNQNLKPIHVADTKHGNEEQLVLIHRNEFDFSLWELLFRLKFVYFRKDNSKAVDGEAKGPAAKKVVHIM